MADKLKSTLSDGHPSNKSLDYDIGYKKPPKHSQFKEGQSGNPKGRPKGAKNKQPSYSVSRISDIISEESHRMIKINEGGKTISMPVIQAAIRSLGMNAAKGKVYSQKLFLEAVQKNEESRDGKHFELMAEAIYYVKGWEKEIEYAIALGNPEPDPIPHPKHIEINPFSGEVNFIGPMTETEKREWDHWVARKINWIELKDSLEQELEENKDLGEKIHIQNDLEKVNNFLRFVTKIIPDDLYIPPSTYKYIEENPDCHYFDVD